MVNFGLKGGLTLVKLEVILMGQLDQGVEALKIMWFFEGLEAGTEWKPDT